ncbi:hypothetical protein SD70_16600 [Gordoniibacillus kamchatkensis]|uniref:Uncharacterized protein n=1 Tax=Gordoniibacillus kamchatkensis TaxID=1590651 RepID=A0ABR5AG97_9BACL|nr:hypothetical protein [Paenibacillus sp. VKM B-2647]KIL39996.1 hypothetical protein SD70_16600 [Paenibacillus sp. VKM B-2647]
MGVKFGRAYGDIIKDFSDALGQIDDLYTCFEMTEEGWQELEPAERTECIRTLADDLFYGLGTEEVLAVGSGTVSHDAERHVLKVHMLPDITAIVYLV